jgi:chromosome segregation ATPase
LNQKQNAARVQVERLQRRNEIIARIESLKVRIPIAKYTAAKQVHTQLKLQRREVHKKVEELKGALDPLKKRTDQYDLRKDQFKRQQETSAKTLDRLKKKIKEYEDNTSAFDVTSNDLRRQKLAIKKASQDQKKTLERLREDVRKLEFAMNECQKKQDMRDLAHEEELQVYLFFFDLSDVEQC